MKTKYILSALLAAGLATAAHAQVVGDLVVGFQQAGNTTNYELDLGSIGNYQNLAPDAAPINLSGDLSSADLTSIFGASALTGGTVTWGAVATNGSTTLTGVTGPAKSTWVSQFDSVATGLAPSLTPPASAYKDTTGTNLNAREIGIQGVETGLAGTNGFVQSSNTANLTGSLPAAAPGSWTQEVTGNHGFPATPTIDGATSLSLAAGQYSVVDLYQYISGATTVAGTYLGSLELSSTGGLFFTDFVPTAIPEPSVYAAILGVATLAFVVIRRRKQQTLA
jgi:hypothetical protein